MHAFDCLRLASPRRSRTAPLGSVAMPVHARVVGLRRRARFAGACAVHRLRFKSSEAGIHGGRRRRPWACGVGLRLARGSLETKRNLDADGQTQSLPMRGRQRGHSNVVGRRDRVVDVRCVPAHARVVGLGQRARFAGACGCGRCLNPQVRRVSRTQKAAKVNGRLPLAPHVNYDTTTPALPLREPFGARHPPTPVNSDDDARHRSKTGLQT